MYKSPSERGINRRIHKAKVQPLSCRVDKVTRLDCKVKKMEYIAHLGGSNRKKKKGLSGVNVPGLTKSNLATGVLNSLDVTGVDLSTIANVLTVSNCLDATSWVTNERVDLAKHLCADSSTEANVRVEAVPSGTPNVTKEMPNVNRLAFPVVEWFACNNWEKYGLKKILEGKPVFMDDDGKPHDKVDYPINLGSDDEVEPIENEMACFLASKSTGVGYGPKSLLEN
nr:hypothetical protein [Tanacetum cinerariifolium]